MTIIEFLRRTFKTRTPWNIPVIRPLVKCADGFTMSVQASANHYCIPRKDAVEVGYPSETTPDFFKYNAGCGVYGCVPIDEVQKVCAKHGGIVGADFSNDKAGYWVEEERIENIVDQATNNVPISNGGVILGK